MKTRDLRQLSHLQLVRMETHKPLNSDFLACARVVDVFSFLQAALVHSNVRQLTKLASLFTGKSANDSKAPQIIILLLHKVQK